MEEMHFAWETLLVADGSGSLFWGGKHGMLICWMVVWFGIQVQVSEGWLSIYSVTQGTIHSSVCIKIQEGKVVIQFSVHGELDVERYAVEVIKEVI